jgi:hypothetical protein
MRCKRIGSAFAGSNPAPAIMAPLVPVSDRRGRFVPRIALSSGIAGVGLPRRRPAGSRRRGAVVTDLVTCPAVTRRLRQAPSWGARPRDFSRGVTAPGVGAPRGQPLPAPARVARGFPTGARDHQPNLELGSPIHLQRREGRLPVGHSVAPPTCGSRRMYASERAQNSGPTVGSRIGQVERLNEAEDVNGARGAPAGLCRRRTSVLVEETLRVDSAPFARRRNACSQGPKRRAYAGTPSSPPT